MCVCEHTTGSDGEGHFVPLLHTSRVNHLSGSQVPELVKVTDLSGEQGHSIQAGVQGGEAHWDELIHLDGSS